MRESINAIRVVSLNGAVKFLRRCATRLFGLFRCLPAHHTEREEEITFRIPFPPITKLFSVGKVSREVVCRGCFKAISSVGVKTSSYHQKFFHTRRTGDTVKQIDFPLDKVHVVCESTAVTGDKLITAIVESNASCLLNKSMQLSVHLSALGSRKKNRIEPTEENTKHYCL